ncbi:sensor histidine kinase [Polaribacter uvawellassae]|uniref:sensor histidine kinase n=1 Tax=Polaribacter uvawellassae TaxID=3133495 RepID=UPI003218EF96
MKYIKPLFFLLILVSTYSFAQTQSSQLNDVFKAEDLILAKQLDSALILLKDLEPTNRVIRLKNIATKETISYADYLTFTAQTGNKQKNDYALVSNFINENISEPSSKKINFDYVKIKWIQTTKLREEKTIAEANIENDKLQKYIEKFDPKDKDVRRAIVYLNIHRIVLYTIERDLSNGKKLALENLKNSRELQDTELIIASLYHLNDFVIIEGKLQEYIDICEEGLELEKTLPNTSNYYYGTVAHALDAYIYKGGHEKRVEELLNILYSENNARHLSYSLYSKYLGTIDLKSPFAKNIFKKFNASNLVDYCQKITLEGEKVLNQNDFFHLVNENSRTLERHNFLKEAILYNKKSVELIQKIYSNDLANSLSDAKSKYAIQEKELEVNLEKERSKLYSIIASLTGFFLVISIFIIIRIIKQRKELTRRNNKIKKQRDDLDKAYKEKELLVREVHHRVKNNFQIVSSLLELQSKGIEDEKALELANEGKNRVKSMALIHQKLYQNKSGLVDFDEYIRLLVKELASLNTSGEKVTTKIASENMFFDVDTAIPLGLIINEIITNAYKYAFSNDKKHELQISISKEKNEEYKLIVKDNGPGLAASYDIKKAKSLGLRLVTRLVKQLQGTLVQTNENGAKFEIHFKDIHARLLTD